MRMISRKIRKVRRVLGAAFREFIETSTIHGVKDACTAPTRKARLIWFVTILFVSGILGYQVVKIAVEYASEPTATFITLSQTPNFPRIVYCMNGWASDVKMEEFGIDYLMYLYISSFMAYPMVTGEISSQFYHGQHKKDIATLDAELSDILKSNNVSFRGLVRAISENGSSIILEAMLDSGKKPEITLVEKPFGLCFSVYSNAKLPVTTSGQPLLVLRVASMRVPFPDSYPAAPYKRWFGFGEDALSWYGCDSYALLSADSDYAVDMHASVLKQLPTIKRRCKVYTEYERSECIFHCKVRELINNECTMYYPGYESNNFTQLCSWAKHSIMWDYWIQLNAAVQCVERECPDTCTKTTYALSITKQVYDDFYAKIGNSSIIEFTLKNQRSTQIVEEYMTYSLSTLLANIGGTVSLFFGASMLSIVQICFFCCYRQGSSTHHEVAVTEDI